MRSISRFYFNMAVTCLMKSRYIDVRCVASRAGPHGHAHRLLHDAAARLHGARGHRLAARVPPGLRHRTPAVVPREVTLQLFILKKNVTLQSTPYVIIGTSFSSIALNLTEFGRGT